MKSSNNTGKGHSFILSFDVEEFTFPKDCTSSIKKEENNKLFSLGAAGLRTVISLLARHKIPATCFCTYEFFRRYPESIAKLSEIGCEIGLHGYNHNNNYTMVNDDKSVSELKKAKSQMEKLLETRILGFRSPYLRAPKISLLEKAGFLYDSSIQPTYLPGRYNHLLYPQKILRFNKILEVPVSVMPFFKLPFSWIWFRNFPLLYSKSCTVFSTRFNPYTLLYFHPWEFVDLSEYRFDSLVGKLVVRNTGDDFVKKCDNFIHWAKKSGKFCTIKDHLKSNSLLPA